MAARTRSKSSTFRLTDTYLRSMLDNMPSGIIHGRIIFEGDEAVDLLHLYTNPAFERFTGLSNVVGKLATEVIPDFINSRPEDLKAYARVARGGKPEHFENYIPDLQRWYAVTLFSTERDHVMLVFNDISRYKLQEQELLESRERLALALENSNLGAWDVNRQTNKLIVDAGWCAILGYQPNEIEPVRTSWLDRIHHEDKERVLATLAAHDRAETDNVKAEYRLQHKDGHWVWVQSCGRVVARDTSGAPLRVVGTLQDVTLQRRLASEGVVLLQRIEAMMRDMLAQQGPVADRDVLQPNPASSLSRRQREILVLIARGMTSGDIGKRLGVGTGTIATHRKSLMKKLNLHSAAELTRFAINQGLLDKTDQG